MAASVVLSSPIDVREFINEYFGAWCVTNEGRIMSYYATEVQLRIQGLELNGAASDSSVQVPGCSVYEFDATTRKITASGYTSISTRYCGKLGPRSPEFL
jgi:hypothetical protein